MVVNVIRPDTVETPQAKLRPGLYLLDDGLDRAGCESVRKLTPLEDDNYLDSEDSQIKSIPDLSSVANRGDILIAHSGGQRLRTYLSSKTTTNTLLVTESCDNRCVFCSQPPKNSTSFFSQAWTALDNFKQDGVIGVSGGEPTMYWSDFIGFCIKCSRSQINRSFHLLTHGRTFSDPAKVQELAETGFLAKTLMGIPVHGHTSQLHDGATGVDGSFHETLKGLVQLAFAGAELEVRVIVTRQNYKSLPQVSRLIASYLSGGNFFVAFMNLEPIGWAKANFKSLSVSPAEYIEPLWEAVSWLNLRAVQARLYNFPMCQVSPALRSYATKSISDWKNYFPAECERCRVRDECCGFFASAEGEKITTPEPVL